MADNDKKIIHVFLPGTVAYTNKKSACVGIENSSGPESFTSSECFTIFPLSLVLPRQAFTV